MIGSVFQQRDELAAIELRRQDIAASSALKAAAEPDAGKRRKAKDRAGHDAQDDTAAVAEGVRAGMEAQAATKTFSERGAVEGPAECTTPAGPPEAVQYTRPYLDDGRHAAESPQADLPRTMPLTHAARGQLQAVHPATMTPIEMSSVPAVSGNAGPLTEAMAMHQAQVSLRPPIPGRAAR